MANNIEIGAYEAKTHLPRLLREVAAGQSFTITLRGKPVAELKPLEENATPRRKPWENRVLLPGFAAIMDKCVGGTDSTQIISEDREDRYK